MFLKCLLDEDSIETVIKNPVSLSSLIEKKYLMGGKAVFIISKANQWSFHYNRKGVLLIPSLTFHTAPSVLSGD